MNSKIWYLPAGCVALGILLLSTVLEIPIQLEGVSGIDKWEHAFAYAVLAGAFLEAFRRNGRLTLQLSIITLLLASVYGLLLEWTQYLFFDHRYFEWKDAIANVLGALIGFLLFHLLIRKNG